MRVVINGLHVDDVQPFMSYDDVVKAAGMRGHPSVTYSSKRAADGSHRSGTMTTGMTIAVTDGMVFSAVYTGNA